MTTAFSGGGAASARPTVPRVAGGEWAEMYRLFGLRAGTLGVTVSHVASVEEASAIVGSLIRDDTQRSAIVSAAVSMAAPGLAGGLTRHGVAVESAGDPAATRDAPLGISWAETAIAETGSVLLAEVTLADRAVGMLVATQVVLVPSAGLRATLEDAADALRAIAGRPGGSYATVVTGPSRTADIERVLTVGVQGPSRLVVIFIDDP